MADHPLTVGTRHKHVPLATTANSYTTGSNRILPHGLAVSPQSPHPSLGGLSTTLSQLARKEKKALYRKPSSRTESFSTQHAATRSVGPGLKARRCVLVFRAATRRAIWSPIWSPRLCGEGGGPSPAFRGDARMHRCRPDPHRCQPHHASLLTDAVSILRQTEPNVPSLARLEPRG